MKRGWGAGQYVLAACFINDLLILLILFALGGLSAMARSEAVLPAYLMGMVLAPYFLKERVLAQRMRVMGSTCQSLVRLAPCTVLVVK